MLLVAFSGSVSAQQIYQVTGSELIRLEQIFSQLSVNNQQLLRDLEESREDLKRVRQRLIGYQQDLAILRKQLQSLRAEAERTRIELEQANNSLRKAGESLNKYEREVRSDIKSLTWQRNGMLLLVGILALNRI